MAQLSTKFLSVKIHSVLIILALALSTPAMAFDESLIENLSSTKYETKTETIELLIADTASYPEILQKIIHDLHKKCEPYARIPETHKAFKELTTQHNIQQLESHLIIISQIIKKQPHFLQAIQLDKLLAYENQGFVLHMIALAEMLKEQSAKYIPNIVRAAKAKGLSGFRQSLFLRKVTDTLKVIGTADAKKAIIALDAWGKQKIARDHAEAQNDPIKLIALHNKQIARKFLTLQSGIRTFRGKYNALVGDTRLAQQYNLGTNGNGNGKIDVNESAMATHQINTINKNSPSTIINEIFAVGDGLPTDIHFAIRHYTVGNTTGNAIIAGAMNNNIAPALAAFTPQRAYNIAKIIKDVDPYSDIKIMNGQGRKNCISGGKVNTASSEISCALVLWIR